MKILPCILLSFLLVACAAKFTAERDVSGKFTKMEATDCSVAVNPNGDIIVVPNRWFSTDFIASMFKQAGGLVQPAMQYLLPYVPPVKPITPYP